MQLPVRRLIRRAARDIPAIRKSTGGVETSLAGRPRAGRCATPARELKPSLSLTRKGRAPRELRAGAIASTRLPRRSACGGLCTLPTAGQARN